MPRPAWRTKRRLTLLLVAALLTVTLGLAGCGPEAERTRGGDEGADIGNRDDTVEVRGDQSAEDRIYFETPRETVYE